MFRQSWMSSPDSWHDLMSTHNVRLVLQAYACYSCNSNNRQAYLVWLGRLGIGGRKQVVCRCFCRDVDFVYCDGDSADLYLKGFSRKKIHKNLEK